MFSAWLLTPFMPFSKHMSSDLHSQDILVDMDIMLLHKTSCVVSVFSNLVIFSGGFRGGKGGANAPPFGG